MCYPGLCLQVDHNRACLNVPNHTVSLQVNIFIITAAVTSNFERTSFTALVIVPVVVVVVVIIIIIIIIIIINPFSRYDDSLTE